MTEREMYDYLVKAGMTPAGACGALGNIQAESGAIANNLQNSYEKKLGYTDAAYTAAVDSGTYTGFDTDRAGYGLCQWTYPARKKNLRLFAKHAGKSIGDAEMQLGFFLKELRESFPTVLAVLKTAKTVQEASDAMLMKFERPADQSVQNCERRAKLGQEYFDKYTRKGSDRNMGFSNSPLAAVTLISPNRTVNRNHVIDTITIHCYVGQVTVERGLNGFAKKERQASCNYVIGCDGRIGLCVEEKDRSWCSGGYDKQGNPIRVNGISGKSNDYQAVTIKKLLWKGDKKLVGKVDQQNLTVHRWFANKACPGDYIYQRLADIAAKVNAKLGASGTSPAPDAPVSKVPYKVRITATDLRIRQGPNTDATIVQKAIAPGVYTIVSEATGKGATLWGKLKSGLGWVSLDYCKKI